ncbi:MAG: hypothetical protein KTR31_25990 [Myxococcales bacterium]|nr:hypothetical protein [Myxococcales bacterium]
MLAAFLGALALAGIPLELFTESDVSLAANTGIGAIVAGVVMFGLGVAVWVGSLFLE